MHAANHRHPVSIDILLVEDDEELAATISEILRDCGHATSLVGDGDDAIAQLRQRTFDLLLCDVRLPGRDGNAVMAWAKENRPDIPIILMTAYGSIEEAVEAVRGDATNYLSKPFSAEQLRSAVGEITERLARRRRATAGSGHPTSAIIGVTPEIAQLREFICTVAETDGAVLITGETGTGKELVARTIHSLSRRSDEPFVAVNCAAFPETLLEAELFGHERGAFTGAVQKREGRFRAADGGTLFLDEVGDMSAGAQAKLLRVLQDGSFQPVGSDVTHHVDVRIISATNQDLRANLGNTFREDLYFRLKMFHAQLPPLRERKEDLPLLVERFLTDLRPERMFRITPRAWAALSHYSYPGNVRELQNTLGHAVAMASEDVIDVKHLPEELRSDGLGEGNGGAEGQSLADAEREFERDFLIRTLVSTDWNKTRAAEKLGISRKTLWKKLRDLGVHSRPTEDLSPG